MAKEKINKELLKAIKNSTYANILFGGKYKKSDKPTFRFYDKGIDFIVENEVFLTSIPILNGNLYFIPIKQDNIEFKFKLPKIPFDIYNQILTFFREVYEVFGTEAYCSIIYNKNDKKYYIDIPKQEVSEGHVSIPSDVFSKIDKSEIIVAEVHSHHEMTGKFSPIDDGYQKIPERIYMVIGDIFSISQSMEIRIKYGDYSRYINFNNIFEYKVDSNIDKWKDKIIVNKNIGVFEWD